MDTRCVLLFLKSPEKGGVKTRLTGGLDGREVVKLYACFVRDAIETVEQTGHAFRLCYHPPTAGKNIVNWFGPCHTLWPQKGKELGERMKNAFVQAFSEGFERVVLIGTDLPDLPTSLIGRALDRLATEKAVIGPATDGGYYLIGFRSDSFEPKIFKKMPWGTGDVFDITMRVFRRFHVNVHVLPAWRDIDRAEDLEDFILKVSATGKGAKNTINYLQEIGYRTRK